MIGDLFLMGFVYTISHDSCVFVPMIGDLFLISQNLLSRNANPHLVFVPMIGDLFLISLDLSSFNTSNVLFSSP